MVSWSECLAVIKQWSKCRACVGFIRSQNASWVDTIKSYIDKVTALGLYHRNSTKYAFAVPSFFTFKEVNNDDKNEARSTKI